MAVYDGEVVDTVSKMTILEIVELIAMMEKKFGQEPKKEYGLIPL